VGISLPALGPPNRSLKRSASTIMAGAVASGRCCSMNLSNLANLFGVPFQSIYFATRSSLPTSDDSRKISGLSPIGAKRHDVALT